MPHPAVATANRRTMALSYANVSTDAAESVAWRTFKSTAMVVMRL